LFLERVRKLLETHEMTCRGRQKSEPRVRKYKKLVELRFAVSAVFA